MKDELKLEGQKRNVELDTVLAACWHSFSTGAREASSAWRLPVVGTIGATGAQLRTVVLREVDEEARLLIFHTDARSPKVRELRSAGEAAWLFFDPRSGVQIRARSRVTTHQSNETTRELWETVPPEARSNYAHPQAPGQPITDGPTESLPDEQAFQNFLVVVGEVVFMDWLQISREGHQRAQFDWDGTAWIGAQVAP